MWSDLVSLVRVECELHCGNRVTTEVHICALVRATLPLRAPGRDHPGVVRPRPVGELLALDTSFVPKSRAQTWGLGWFWNSMARAARRDLEVSLLVAVGAEEGGAYLLGTRQSPGATQSHRGAYGAATGRETTIDAGLILQL